jgi:hypothetical protein
VLNGSFDYSIIILLLDNALIILGFCILSDLLLLVLLRLSLLDFYLCLEPVYYHLESGGVVDAGEVLKVTHLLDLVAKDSLRDLGVFKDVVEE